LASADASFATMYALTAAFGCRQRQLTEFGSSSSTLDAERLILDAVAKSSVFRRHLI
jgi:hypothetical protein